MPDSVRLRVVGFPELHRTLQELPRRLRSRIAKTALRRAATPILQAARRNLRWWLRQSQSDYRPGGRDPGNLMASLKGRKARIMRMGPTGPYIVIGPSYPLGNHGFLFEYGTRRQRARPFLRPAIDTTRYKAKRIVKEVVRTQLAREARRLVKRAGR